MISDGCDTAGSDFADLAGLDFVDLEGSADFDGFVEDFFAPHPNSIINTKIKQASDNILAEVLNSVSNSCRRAGLRLVYTTDRVDVVTAEETTSPKYKIMLVYGLTPVTSST